MLTLHPNPHIRKVYLKMTRKVFVIIISVLLPVLAWGQAQINTKKVKIGDFTQKITKVVLSGNEFMDSALKDEVTARVSSGVATAVTPSKIVQDEPLHC